jgi:putative transposase
VKANQATYPVRAMCRLLGVSASGFYAWDERPLSKRALEDIALTAKIHGIHRRSRECYGAPRIHAELAQEHDIHVGRKRVARLMRAARLEGVSRRRFVRTTIPDIHAHLPPDLVDRHFRVKELDRLWVADITYIPTWAGFLYLAMVLDACSRRVVGWAMANHLRTELVLSAINMALEQRHPERVIHHSDRGCQYTSFAFGKRCTQMGVQPSVGSAGDAYDNAMAESFFASLECELLDRSSFHTQEEARLAVFEYIEGFYNPRRRHSSLGQRSPMQFERDLRSEPAARMAHRPSARSSSGQTHLRLTPLKRQEENRRKTSLSEILGVH